MDYQPAKQKTGKENWLLIFRETKLQLVLSILVKAVKHQGMLEGYLGFLGYLGCLGIAQKFFFKHIN